MSTANILRATLRWHIRKGRRLFHLAVNRLAAPPAARQGAARTGVRWG